MKVDLERFTKPCPCGHEHKITVKGVWIEPGAVNRLDELLAGYAHPVILCDGNTKKAAEKQSSLRGCLPSRHFNGNISAKFMPWGPACRPTGENADA